MKRTIFAGLLLCLSTIFISSNSVSIKASTDISSVPEKTDKVETASEWNWYDLSDIDWSSSTTKKASEELGITDSASFFTPYLSWTYDESLSEEEAKAENIWICDTYSTDFLGLDSLLHTDAASALSESHSSNYALLAIDFSILGDPDEVSYYDCHTDSYDAQMVQYVWKYKNYDIVFPWLCTADHYSDSMNGVYVVSPEGYEHYFGKEGVYTNLYVDNYDSSTFQTISFDKAESLSQQ